MGYNTVIMFRNDAYSDFKNNPKETMENILAAMDDKDNHHYGVGSHANPMEVMKPRHMSDTTIYVHAGNTLSEMSVYRQETIDLMENHPEFFEQMLDFMEQKVKSLKKEYKLHKQFKGKLNV